MCVESGNEESLENKKQIDTSVSETLLKVLEILPTDTKVFLHPALTPPAVSKKREPEKVPSQAQTAKKSKSLKSVAAADGVSLGHIDLMVAQLNKGIFGKMGSCGMIEKVYVPNVLLKTPSPSYGVSVVPDQYATHVTQNKTGHGSQILFDLVTQFGNVQFVPSGTTAEKGSTDKDKATTNRNLAQGKENDAVHTVTSYFDPVWNSFSKHTDGSMQWIPKQIVAIGEDFHNQVGDGKVRTTLYKVR